MAKQKITKEIQKITDKQLKMIELMTDDVAIKSKSAIAEELGISRNALYVWLNMPEIQAELQRRREHAISAARQMLSQLAKNAVVELWNLVKNANSESIKKDAIVEILNRCDIVESKQPANVIASQMIQQNIGIIKNDEIQSVKRALQEFETGNDKDTSNNVRKGLFVGAVQNGKAGNSDSAMSL